MAYLEYQSADQIPSQTSYQLRSTHPKNWLPFVLDTHLWQWCDHVGSLIQSGGARALSVMLARSCRMTPDELEAIVLSPSQMADEAFHKVSSEQLAVFQSETTRRCRAAVLKYLTAES
jgi:hypothetical protein